MLSLKWGTQNFELAASPSTGGALKAAIAAVTGVPADRQKLMSKAWKGLLKDDAALALSAGTLVTLMGSAETASAPTEAVKFVEDATKAEIAKSGAALPVGLVNVGNTCYANSALQCLRVLPELRDSVTEHAVARRGASGLAAPLGDLFTGLDSAGAPVPPIRFLTALRAAYPQFGGENATKQQDSDEFVTSILNSLASELQSPSRAVSSLISLPGSLEPRNIIDSLLGISFDTEMSCTESADEPVVTSKEGVRKREFGGAQRDRNTSYTQSVPRVSAESTRGSEKHVIPPPPPSSPPPLLQSSAIFLAAQERPRP